MEMEILLSDTNNSFEYNNNVSKWIINISEIGPYKSAVLGNNYLAFYIIHSVALSLICTSMISCCIVICTILCRSRKQSWDFADRFPFYLAIADGLWGISHFIDHMVAVTALKFPNSALSTGLSVNLWFFLGYQQLMHAGLAVYTYIKIVHGVAIDLGKGEWKLHTLVLSTVAMTVAVFYPLGSFGVSGYWFLQDVSTTAGLALGCFIATSCTVHALCTTVGYRSIKKAVEAQRLAMLMHSKGQNVPKTSHHSTASECLTTFVRISLALYCPLAIGYWTCVIESIFGFLEPATPLVIVIVANSSGWANALGYFYNNQVKARRIQSHDTTFSNQSNSTFYST